MTHALRKIHTLRPQVRVSHDQLYYIEKFGNNCKNCKMTWGGVGNVGFSYDVDCRKNIKPLYHMYLQKSVAEM